MDRNIIICDIDGTIANVEHRLHYIRNPDGSKKSHKDSDWDSFHAECVNDEPYKDVIEILGNLYDAGRRRDAQGTAVCDREVCFFSGRNESVRREPIEWLWKYVITPSMCHEVAVTPEYTEECRKAGWHFTLRDNDTTQLQPNLFMRGEDDRRPDTAVKLGMLNYLGLTPNQVLCILDDRQSVVDMWRQNGFRVMQVAAWKE